MKWNQAGMVPAGNTFYAYLHNKFGHKRGEKTGPGKEGNN